METKFIMNAVKILKNQSNRLEFSYLDRKSSTVKPKQPLICSTSSSNVLKDFRSSLKNFTGKITKSASYQSIVPTQHGQWRFIFSLLTKHLHRLSPANPMAFFFFLSLMTVVKRPKLVRMDAPPTLE